jgi:hypothetical protein
VTEPVVFWPSRSPGAVGRRPRQHPTIDLTRTESALRVAGQWRSPARRAGCSGAESGSPLRPRCPVVFCTTSDHVAFSFHALDPAAAATFIC